MGLNFGHLGLLGLEPGSPKRQKKLLGSTGYAKLTSLEVLSSCIRIWAFSSFNDDDNENGGDDNDDLFCIIYSSLN